MYLYGEAEVDSSGNFYQVGVSDRFIGCCPTYRRPVVAKGTLSGLSFVRAQTTFNSTPGQDITPAALVLESGSNLVVCGSYNNNDLYLLKMGTASGTTVHQGRYNGIAATQPAFVSMGIDKADNFVS